MTQTFSTGGGNRNSVRTLFKRRRVLFSAKDEAMFSEALRERYPAVQFLRRFPGQDPLSAIPQPLLLDIADQYVEILLELPGDAQAEDTMYASNGRRRHRVRQHLTLLYDRSTWDWARLPHMSYDPPTLNVGEISGSYEPENPDHAILRKIFHQIWKIIEQLATNRYKSGHLLRRHCW